jgi:hypothetical protein
MSSEFVRYSPEIETIDPQIDELVPQIYSASAKVRRTLNHQPETEPTSAAAVLG